MSKFDWPLVWWHNNWRNRYGAKPTKEKLWRQMTGKQWYQNVWQYITPWSRALIEKLTGSELVKKFSIFYGTQKFITAFRNSDTCPCRQPDQPNPCLPYPLLEDSFLYYPPIRVQVLQVVSFPQVSPPISLRTSPVSHACHMPRSSHFPWDDHPNNIWWGVKIIKLLVV